MLRVILCVLCLLCSRAFADREGLIIAAHDYYPYIYFDEGSPTGSHVELVKTAFERMGLSPSIDIMPWNRALLELERGRIDGLFSAFHTPERGRYADYSDPIDDETVALFVRKDSDIQFDGDLSKLGKFLFGIPRAYSTGWQLDSAIEDGVVSNIIGTGTAERAYKMLLLGWFDILPANREAAWMTFTQLGAADQVKELKPALTTMPLHLIFSKQRNLGEVVKQFNGELARMRSDGSYDQIMRVTPIKLPAN